MVTNGTYPHFDPEVIYPAFKLNRSCDKCKLGDGEGETPAAASYDFNTDHIRRRCAVCGFMWWERPKGD